MLHTRSPRGVASRTPSGQRHYPGVFSQPGAPPPPGRARGTAARAGATCRLQPPRIVIELASVDSETPVAERTRSKKQTALTPCGTAPPARTDGAGGGAGRRLSITGGIREEAEDEETCRRPAVTRLCPPAGARRRRSSLGLGREGPLSRATLCPSSGLARSPSQPVPPAAWPTPLHGGRRRASQPSSPARLTARAGRRGTLPHALMSSDGQSAVSRSQLASRQRRYSDVLSNRPIVAPPLPVVPGLPSEPNAVDNRPHRDTSRREPEAQPRKRDAEVVVSDLRNGNVSAPTVRLLGLVPRVPTPGKMRCLLRRLDSPPVSVLSERSRRVTIQFHSEDRGVPNQGRARSFSMPAMEYTGRGSGGGIVCKTDDVLSLQESFKKCGTPEEGKSAAGDASASGGNFNNQSSQALSTGDSVVPWEGNGVLVNVWAIGKALEDYLNVSDNFNSR